MSLNKEKKQLIENLAILVSSGTSIVSSLEAIEQESKNGTLKKTIKQMKGEIEEGISFWSALKNTKLFSEFIVSLVKIGEKSGKLSENLRIISRQQQKDENLKSKVFSAMLYPVIVVTLTMIIGIGIAWFILPNLANVFSQLKIELPLLTRILINFGKFLSNYGYIAIPIFIIFFLTIFYFIFVNSKTKHLGYRLLFKIPGINRLLKEIELTRFSYILGTMLQSGIHLEETLSLLGETTSSPYHKNLYLNLKNNIGEGNSFYKSLVIANTEKKVFPGTFLQIISTGEQSGHLSDVFLKTSELYENKIEATIKNLAVLIEPILLVIVWVGVLIVALSVILPIYGLVGNFNP